MRLTKRVLSIAGAVAIGGLLSSAAVAQTAATSPSTFGPKEMATVLAAVLAALIAAFVAVAGWLVGHELTTRRDDRTKRLELTIEQSEKQISEFYAPLLFLFGQLKEIVKLRNNIIKDKKHGLNIEEGKRVEDVVGGITYKEYFIPIHNEINTILKTKIHLLEGGVIPSSLFTYTNHFTSEHLSWRLCQEEILTWDSIKPFPDEFPNLIKEHQKLVYKRYEDAVQELRHGAFAKSLFSRTAKAA